MNKPDFALRDFFGDRRQELIAHIPHAVELGMTMEQAGPCQALIRIPQGERLLGAASRGVVFGGVITTLLDQVGGAAVMCSLRELTSIATIDLRIDYMRPSTPGRDLLGHAQCYRLTRNVAFVKARAFHDGELDDPFAIALSTFMLAANPTPPGVMKALRSQQP
ncbi:MAG: PaaI family thioesterase [Deltaproteobacteria bacterium]|nr:PaaI family thioesterase [Deltaproteobacteria bacterium]